MLHKNPIFKLRMITLDSKAEKESRKKRTRKRPERLDPRPCYVTEADTI